MSDREEDFGDKAAGAQGRTAAASVAARDMDLTNGPRMPRPGMVGALAAAAVVAAGAAVFIALRYGVGERINLLEPSALAGLAIAGAATLVLAGIAWWTIRALAGRAQRSSQRTSDLLEILSGLSLESDFGWQDPRLHAHDALARFMAGVQERDHTQQQQLARAARRDQEITRLGTALLAKDRAAVLAEYRDAAVGRAGSGAALLYEEIDRLERELASARVRLSELGGQAAGGSAEAWRWNAGAQARLNAQAAAAEGLAHGVEKLVTALREKLSALEGAEQGEVAQARATLAGLPDGAADARADELARAAQAIKDLVARGGSLAIQTALEVTRLGERGEALFPLTDSLKALVTEFQDVATRLERVAREQGAIKEALSAARRMLAAMDAGAAGDIPEAEAWRRTVERVAETHAALRRQSAELAELAQAFGSQSGRLQAIGGALADLTGMPSAIPAEAETPEPYPEEPAQPVAAEPGEPPAAEPAGPMAAVGEMTPPPAAEPEPPAAFEPEPPASAESEQSPTLELVQPTLTEHGQPAVAEPRRSIFATEPEDTAEPQEPPTPVEAPAQTDLHDDSERIYDLGEFGAVALDAETASEDEERIYDLSEFGAVALG